MEKGEGKEKRMSQSEYGYTLYRLAGELKIQERKICDFSAPVNPLGVSKKVKAEVRKHLKYLHQYPDDDATRLRKKLGLFHSIDPGTVLCGNGSTELLYLAAKALKPRKVLIPAPVCADFESLCGPGAGAEVVRCRLKSGNNFDLDPDEFIMAMEGKSPDLNLPELLPGDQGGTDNSPHPVEMAFLRNPNDLTGRLLAPRVVKKIADAARDLRCYLIVDEAYIDFCSGESMINEVVHNPYLFVLRSMSPFYALAGIRFGYGVFPAECIDRLRANRLPWTVNSIAQQAAAAALKDKTYRRESALVLRKEKSFLEKSFRKLGLLFYPSDANFYLVKTESASQICRRLRGKGILVRDCSDVEGLDSTYMRVAVKSHKDNAMLVKELAGIRAQEA